MPAVRSTQAIRQHQFAQKVFPASPWRQNYFPRTVGIKLQTSPHPTHHATERSRSNAAIPQEIQMSRTTLWSTARMAALTLAVTLFVSGLALARDDDDYYRRGGTNQARQYGYERGFHDGQSKGRHEGRERDPYDYRSPDWRQASKGYKGWMGPVDWYRRGYQDGYASGFRSGYQEVAGPRDGYYGGYNRGRSYGESFRGGYDQDAYGGGNIAYRFGYEDGSSVAREDIYKRKSYNPNPRGRYDDADHGYRREYGNKNQYKADYANGYRAGYEAVMNHSY
jgi:hypothetical protein